MTHPECCFFKERKLKDSVISFKRYNKQVNKYVDMVLYTDFKKILEITDYFICSLYSFKVSTKTE